MTQPSFTVAHHFAPNTGALLDKHPLVLATRAIDLAKRWELPTDVEVIFALHGQGVHVTDHNVQAPPGWPGKVRLVQIASAGLDHYPDWLFDGPQVASSAGTSAVPISEYVLAAMLAHEKRLPAIYASDGSPVLSSDQMVANPLGSLDGKTLGLIGIGQIGGRVAMLARAFGMRVIAQRRSSAAAPEGIEIVPLDTLLARADHIVVAAPLTPETTGLLDAAAFAKTKRGAFLVNIARGGIVDTAALIAALDSGQLSGAALDVTDPEPLPAGHPLWAAPNVRITTHIAWSSAGTPGRIFKLLADNITRLATGEPLLNLLPPGGGPR